MWPSATPGSSRCSRPTACAVSRRSRRSAGLTRWDSTRRGTRCTRSCRRLIGRRPTATSEVTPGTRPGDVVEGKRLQRVPIRQLVAYYLRLGALGFGGPVALCGQMERELVQERQWLTKDEMREGIAVCQSLPGPLAIQVGIFISYIRGGFWGAWAGGWAFILPNFVIVSVLGALYVHFGGLPLVTAIFYGVSPTVIALILHSCYRLARLGMEDWLQWSIAATSFAVTVALQTEVALVFVGAGILGIVFYGSLGRGRASSLPVVALVPLAVGSTGGAAQAGLGATLGKLLVFFLKAGSLTFGSGLVIVPFLETGLVHQTGWLDERQFLVAVGMLSPGPVVITATFVAYLVAVMTTGPGLSMPIATATRNCRSSSQPVWWTRPVSRNGTITSPLPNVSDPAFRKKTSSLPRVAPPLAGAAPAAGPATSDARRTTGSDAARPGTRER